MIRADKAYYRTHRGDVVGVDHPDRQVLICKAGEIITPEVAREIGLIQPAGNPVEAPAIVVEAEATVQAVTEPPKTQAVTPPKRAAAKAKAKPKAKA